MENSPLVSAIIPIYNVEKYLVECVNSCINQTFSNLEIILVNDGSTDASGVLCDDFIKIDKRIKVIHKENGGLSSARNTGLEAATGDFICFLDSDDWMNVNAIEESLSLSQKYDADIVFWSCIKEYEHRSEHYKVYSSTKPYEVFEHQELEVIKRRTVGLLNDELQNPTKTDSFLTAWGKLFKSAIIKNNRLQFLDTKLVGSEDSPFNIQAFYFANKIVYLNKHYNHYRMFNENSLTKNHSNTLFIRLKNLYEILFFFLTENKLPKEYFDALNNRFAVSIINNCLSISSTRYDVSIFIKLKDVKKILYDNTYYQSLTQLKTEKMPFVWKVFFSFAKKRNYIMCLLMTLIYRKINKL